MSNYIYTFVRGEKEIEVEGCNLWAGAEKAGVHIFRADKLGSHYLQSTPFEKRERVVWASGEMGGMEAWTVRQRYNSNSPFVTS